jgi:dTDP-glucose 4,6-dehydratase
VYNIGGRSECSNLQLVRTLCEIADELFASQPELRSRYPASPASHAAATSSLITFVRDRPGHDRRYATDCSKIERTLDFRPTVTLATGLRQTFEWYLSNESWWRTILEGKHHAAAQSAESFASL